jgi:aspartate/methionine/tyrosine aminotransferase
LTEVAKDYEELEWMELFSMSKTFSACGWRLGIAV